MGSWTGNFVLPCMAIFGCWLVSEVSPHWELDGKLGIAAHARIWLFVGILY